jgi:hypothetical protein
MEMPPLLMDAREVRERNSVGSQTQKALFQFLRKTMAQPAPA